MTDYWNDPPEYPEPPECCDDYMDVLDDGSCKCLNCGKTVAAPMELDPPWENSERGIEEEPEIPALCPHGNEWGECAPCDHLSDLAYDAARESKF